MKELKAELKRGILHGKIIYVMMMVAILFALGCIGARKDEQYPSRKH